MDLDWLIVGGGVHGVHLAARLLGEADVPADRLRIVDPAVRLLDRWKTCTALTGMQHLRSPSVHHLGIKPMALRLFARHRMERTITQYAPPYDRPALELFNAHCDDIIQTFGLDALHVRGRVTACTIDCDGVSAGLSNGETLTARHLVLAIGNSEQPCWPDWAPQDHTRIHHVFQPDFEGWPTDAERVVIVGGGISAAQVALRLCHEGHQVRLVTRHPWRQHQFDSDPGWLGPKFLRSFHQEPDLGRRRAAISLARHRGSVPPAVYRALRGAIEAGQIQHHQQPVDRVEPSAEKVVLHLADGAALVADRVLLATGFASGRPGGAWVDALIASAALPCAPCGYPIVDAALHWHPRIFVSGPLAELELGPAARNIAGARRAGDRIVGAVAAQASARQPPTAIEASVKQHAS
jgi:cation diffusion facilitator CzcD-associated flavoprotein CzcO